MKIPHFLYVSIALAQGNVFHFVFHRVLSELKGGPQEDECPSVLAFCTTVHSHSLKLTRDRLEKICQVHKNINIRIAGTVVCNLKKNKQTKPNKRKKKILIRSSILIAYNYRKHNYTQTYTYILHYITM